MVSHTSSFLRLDFVEINMFAMSSAKAGAQMGQHLNSSLCRVQISNRKIW